MFRGLRLARPETGIMDQVAPAAAASRAPVSWTGQARDRMAARFGFLDRPLTDFYLVLGITTLLVALGLVMVLSTSSAADLMAGSSPWSGLQHQLLGVLRFNRNTDFTIVERVGDLQIRVSVIYYGVDDKDVELHCPCRICRAGSAQRIEIFGDHRSGIRVGIRR